MRRIKKRNISILIITIVLTLTILCGFTFFKRDSIEIYKTDIIADDIRINNFTLVSFNNNIYVQDGYVLKLTKEGSKVDSLNLDIQVDGKRITDFAGGDMFKISNERIADNFNVVEDVKVSKDSNMIVKMKYTIDGVVKEFHDTIKMNFIIKFDGNKVDSLKN